jgi:hypothetical protein
LKVGEQGGGGATERAAEDNRLGGVDGKGITTVLASALP